MALLYHIIIKYLLGYSKDIKASKNVTGLDAYTKVAL